MFPSDPKKRRRSSFRSDRSFGLKRHTISTLLSTLEGVAPLNLAEDLLRLLWA